MPVFSRAVSIVSAAIAVGTGLVVLFGYFFEVSILISLRLIFLQWAIFLAAVALLIGVINLLVVHISKLRGGGASASYSLVLILALAITFGLGAFLGPDHTIPRWVFENVQVPIETSLMAILAISLAYASARLLHRRTNLFSIIFVGTALVVLLGSGAFLGLELPFIGDVIRPWLAQVPAAAGARGILMGVALGTIATGLRILMAADRPYGG